MNIDRHMAEVAENDALRSDERLLLELLAACSPVKRGASWKCLCPVHAERTPSCEVRRGKDGAWRWKCFGCSKGGDVFDLVVALEGCTFREARQRLGTRVVAPAAPKTPAQPKSRERAGEAAPTHVLICDRRACTNTRDVTLVEVAVLLDTGEVSQPTPGEFRWACPACRQQLQRDGRWWALWRLMNAPRRARAQQQERRAA